MCNDKQGIDLYPATSAIKKKTSHTKTNNHTKQTKKRGGENSRRRRVQVHLSRLWTDTPVQVKTQNRERKNETGQKHGEKRESTSAPVTSMDRHTSTGETIEKTKQRE
jgi:hypothetical protein